MTLRSIPPYRLNFVLAVALLGTLSGWSGLSQVAGEEPKAGEASPPPAVTNAAPSLPMDKALVEKEEAPPATSQSAAPMPATAPPPAVEPPPPAASNPPAPPDATIPAAATTPAPESPPAMEPPEPSVSPNDKNVGLKFNFRYQPWEDVLNWFAQQAGFSLVMNAPPAGTFNYSDDHSYTPAEAIDLLNGVLLTKGYTLLLRDRMLMLINLEDGIPPNLVSTVPNERLDERGEFELVSTLFQLENLRPEEAEAEIKKLLGPQGAVVALPKAQQLLVTETVGRLRTIREVIHRADNSGSGGPAQVQKFVVPPGTTEEVLGMLRQMFNIPAGQNATADGTVRMAWDPGSMQLLVAAPSGKMEQIGKILQALTPASPAASEATGMQAVPQLEVYEVYPADPESALKVLQTLLAGVPGVRLTTDPKTGSLVALARPAEHATIRATLDQMQRDALRVEVLRLRIADPQTAAQSIQKLFGTDAKAPSVQPDLATRQLLVRGSEAQLEQIRSILTQMGETDLTSGGNASGGNVRMIPITGPAARSALERLEEIWPTMHQNQIRIVTPSAVIPTLRPSTPPEDILPPSAPEESEPESPSPAPSTPSQAPVQSSTSKTTAASAWAPVVLVANETPPKADATAPSSSPAAQPTAPVTRPVTPEQGSAPIIVAPGPGGVVIASDDVKALDEFESMLKTLVGSASGGGSNMTIFYLKYAKANSVGETLDRVLGGGTLPPEYYQQQQQPGFPGMFVMPGGRGMPGAPSPTPSTPAQNPVLRITPDSRLNALIVRAGPTDLALIEELLKILDQRESPEEILAQAKPRLVPVYNTQADEIVTILKQVYSDRIGSSSSGSSGGSSGPPPFMMMFRGMRGSRGGGGGGQSSSSSSRSSDDTQKMSLGVDARTNSVIVAAPEPLFEEVKQLIEQLDAAADEANTQTMRVVTLHKASLDAVEQALSSLMGDSVQVSRTPAAAGSPSQMSGRQSYMGSTPSRSQTGRSGSTRQGTSRQTPRPSSSSRSSSGRSTTRSYGGSR